MRCCEQSCQVVQSAMPAGASVHADLDEDTNREESRDHRLVYSVSEAAALLGISRAFAYELVARGELPVICLGRRRLVPKVALLAFIDPRACSEGQIRS